MKPTIEILERLHINTKNNPDEVFTKLFRYMLRPDIYYLAYKKLYANSGAATKGVDDDTADGFSEGYVNNIIDSLKSESYRPKPVRRIHIPKSNGKMRPLGIPTFTDKLVQEVMRMILEAVYEPVFLDSSHGFRPKRSCHTVLKSIKYKFPGTSWFIEGDITGCFDNIDHEVLVRCVRKKVKDARFTKLLYAFLKAGYMEDWRYNETYSGTPQGGIMSPILANIYLHELDKYVEVLQRDFAYTPPHKHTPEYRAIRREMNRLEHHIRNKTGEEREAYMSEWREQRARLVQTPCTWRIDKHIYYVRYADDWLIGVKGSKEDCVRIKFLIGDFLHRELKMELSAEKTLITHSSNLARFLGYDVSIRRNAKLKPGNSGRPKRTLNNSVDLAIPFKDKIEKYLFSHGIVAQGKTGRLEPIKRSGLIRLSDMEIVSAYNSELRGLCNYYNLASNFRKLNYFGYLMEYSCLKTLAAKYRSKISKIRRKYGDGRGEWCIPYETRKGERHLYLAKYSDCKSTDTCSDAVSRVARNHAHQTTTFEKRLMARVCELCGAADAEDYELHHVNKVKNLKGKKKWEMIMIAKRRKTMVVCHDCHMKIHHGF